MYCFANPGSSDIYLVNAHQKTTYEKSTRPAKQNDFYIFVYSSGVVILQCHNIFILLTYKTSQINIHVIYLHFMKCIFFWLKVFFYNDIGLQFNTANDMYDKSGCVHDSAGLS